MVRLMRILVPAVLAILLFLTLSLGVIMDMAFDRDFYEEQFSLNGATARFGDGAMAAAENVMDYLRGQGLLSDFFNEREKAHMVDVKGLFDTAEMIALISLVLAVLIVLYLYWKMPQQAVRLVGLGLILVLPVAGLVALLIMVQDFSTFWKGFHELVFSNDLWLLDPETDNMIVLFAGDFFSNMVERIIVSIGLLSLLCAGVGVVLYRWKAQLKKGRGSRV
ncbi:MAG: TIGR01906 family membrane protein [archaeon]